MSLKTLTPTQNVIGASITALSFDSQIELMLNWASHRASKFICVANVHMVMEAYRKPEFATVLSAADMVTPDGMPLVWLMSRMGGYRQDRVAGMDILLGLFQNAPNKDISLFFLGSEQHTLDRIRERLQQEFPAVKIAGMEPLPFRPLTPEEDAAVVQKINDSGAGIVLVCLGCPKQEIWMQQHRGQIEAVMIGVGGAFPVYAGDRKWAPIWVRKAGLEWFYRLIQEPRRLWKRYYSTIPPFIFLALKQLLTDRSKSQRSYQAG